MNGFEYNIYQILIKLTRKQAKKYPKGTVKRKTLMNKVQELGKYIYFNNHSNVKSDEKYKVSSIKFLKYVYLSK